MIWRAVACGVLSLVYCVAASAHSQLLRAEPPIGGEIAAPPHELRLQFSEPIEPAFLALRLTVDGVAVDDLGPPVFSEDKRIVRISVPTRTGERYEVEWGVLSRDGHWTKAHYQFMVRSH